MSSTISDMASTASASASASQTSSAGGSHTPAPASYKIIGVSLAIVSGLLIGASFVVKKKGLIQATKKSGGLAGEGHAYLKNWIWWTGMIMMILGEVCNFAAFAFTAAILVTPLGALSVVVCAILSKFFLQETLTFFGWLGCALVILGATILALNAPETQSAETIPVFQKLWVSAGFLSWAGVCIVASLFLAFWVAPRYGKTNQFVYIGICSLIGGLSVSTLQGVGAAIMTSIRGDNQFKHWFLYVVTVFTVITLLIEINYLNKALELFNTSMVTPTYYVIFTSCTLISSFILYRGLKTSAVQLVTMIMGFLVTCLGITLLQMSKVDPKNFEKLDRRSTMLMAASRNQAEDVEKNGITALEEPGMDALRGGFGTVGSIIRARSARRLSNASTLPGHPMSSGNSYSRHWQPAQTISTDVPRYSLSDRPMGDDTFDQVSLRSGVSDHAQRRGTLKFDDNDVVHQYDRKGKVEALHTSHVHLHAGESPGQFGSPSRPSYGNRGYSGSSIGPILEVPGETQHQTPFDERGASDTKNPYGRDLTLSASPIEGSRNLPTLENDVADAPFASPRTPQPTDSRGSFHFLLDRFTHSDSPDLKLQSSKSQKSVKQSGSDDMRRGGAHRGTKDYPHLRKEEAEVEREERQGLVTGSDEEELTGLTDRSDNDTPPLLEEKQPKARRSSRHTNSISSMPRPLPYLPTSNVASETRYPPGK